MKRLRNRSRWPSRGQKHVAAGSLSCLPVSLLCRDLPPSSPPPVKVPPVTAASSLRPRSTTVDDVNHVDRNVDHPRTNGTALLGGNGLQSYDDFIATLLRERSLVKDGVAADPEKIHVNKRPRTLPAARLRQRRPFTDRKEDEPRDEVSDSRSLLGVVRKPAEDRSFVLKSERKDFISAVSKDDGVSTVAEYVCEQRETRTELDAGWPTTETPADVARSTSTKLNAWNCSPRQRQRQRRRKRKTRRQGVTTATKGCDSASTHTPDEDDYSVTKESTTVLVGDSISEHCDKAAVDRRQDSGRDLVPSCAYRDPFHLVSTTTTSQVSEYKPSRRIIAIVCGDSKLATLANVYLQHEDAVDLSGFSVGASVIPFIDCDNPEVESFQQETERMVSVDQEDQTRSRLTSIVVDRWKNAGSELTYSSPRTRTSSLQFGGRAYMAGDLRGSSVCRCRSTLTQCDERTANARWRRQGRSYPLLTRSAIDQISEMDASLASLDQLTRCVGTHEGSQLLETCRCSIAWPQTASDVVHSEAVSKELFKDRRSPNTTSRAIRSSNTTTDISTAPQLNRQTSNDLKRPSPDCQHLVGATVSLPFTDVAQLNPEKSSRDRQRSSADQISVDRRDVHVFCVLGRRRRRENARCDSRASKCLLRIELVLTRSRIEDQRTTLLFAQRKTVEERDQAFAAETDDVQNLPFRCNSTCSTSDVMLTVINDDIDDVTNDAEQHVDMARNSTTTDGVASLTISKPSSVEGAFDTPPPNTAHSAIGAAHLAVDGRSVDASTRSTPCEISSGNLNDVSQSLTVYEFAEVTSIFRNFAADLLPATGRELSLVPYGAARRREDKSTSKALVRRAGPGVTYSGAVVPYGTPPPASFPLPLMTWTWSRDNLSGSRQQATYDDVTHIPYVSACTTLNVEPFIDHFALV